MRICLGKSLKLTLLLFLLTVPFKIRKIKIAYYYNVMQHVEMNAMWVYECMRQNECCCEIINQNDAADSENRNNTSNNENQNAQQPQNNDQNKPNANVNAAAAIDANVNSVYYCSKATCTDESRIHSYKLETLAIVYALRNFRNFNNEITTDCGAFSLTFPKNCQMGIRITEFNVFDATPKWSFNVTC